MPHQPLKVALLAPYPASAVLSRDQVKDRYWNREHPAPWIQNLCSEFNRCDNLKVSVFSDSRAVRKLTRCERENIEYVFTPKLEPASTDPYHAYLPGIIRLRRQLAAFRPDVVHGFGTENCYGLAAALSGWPAVIFVQGIVGRMGGYTGFSPLQMFIWRCLERKAVRGAQGIIAETSFAAEWARSINEAAVIEIVPHILDRRYLQATCNYSRREILCIGSLSQIKGTDLILKMFAGTVHSQSRLIFIGDGVKRSAYESLAARLGISSSVEFCGRMTQAEIAEKMATARLVVIGSRMDTSPNVITEAHAAGLPVVGTDAGGIPEMIRHGEDGYIVPLGDSTGMASRVDYLLDHPEICRDMGRMGREKVLRLNDPGLVTAAHLKMYAKLARTPLVSF